MRKFIFGIGLILSVTASQAQKLDLERIMSIAEAKSNIESDTIQLCKLYILDGITYTTVADFEKQLESLEGSDIKLATIADLSNSQIYCRICDFVLLVGTGQNQSKKYKSEQLRLIRTNLNENLPELIINDFNCENCHQLIVDGNPIETFKARELVNKLKPKEIQFIVSYQTANPEIYGNNAVNGLTEIFLKSKADNRR